MEATRRTILPGYVKVEVRSRAPKLWGWSLCRDSTDIVLERSDALYRCAEDAWQAGRVALRSLRPGHEPEDADP